MKVIDGFSDHLEYGIQIPESFYFSGFITKVIGRS